MIAQSNICLQRDPTCEEHLELEDSMYPLQQLFWCLELMAFRFSIISSISRFMQSNRISFVLANLSALYPFMDLAMYCKDYIADLTSGNASSFKTWNIPCTLSVFVS